MRIFLLSCLVLFVACDSKRENKDDVSGRTFYRLLETFTLPHDRSLYTDETSFIFIKNSSWDTSFVLTLKKYPTQIRAVYYQTIPDYHRTLTDYFDKDHTLYFDGFSFDIDTTTWNAMVTESMKLRYSIDTLQSGACQDGTNYILSHASNLKYGFCGNKEHIDDFRKYEDYLRQKLLNDVYRRKLNLNERADKEMREEKLRDSHKTE
jgi:hypothetical protein